MPSPDQGSSANSAEKPLTVVTGEVFFWLSVLNLVAVGGGLFENLSTGGIVSLEVFAAMFLFAMSRTGNIARNK